MGSEHRRMTRGPRRGLLKAAVRARSSPAAGWSGDSHEPRSTRLTPDRLPSSQALSELGDPGSARPGGVGWRALLLSGVDSRGRRPDPLERLVVRRPRAGSLSGRPRRARAGPVRVAPAARALGAGRPRAVRGRLRCSWRAGIPARTLRRHFVADQWSLVLILPLLAGLWSPAVTAIGGSGWGSGSRSSSASRRRSSSAACGAG